jgi:hypothetical protein
MFLAQTALYMDISSLRYHWQSQCFETKIAYCFDTALFSGSFNHALQNVHMSRLGPGQLHPLITVTELIPIEVLEAAGTRRDFDYLHLSYLLSDIECLTPGTSLTLLGLCSREPGGLRVSRGGDAQPGPGLLTRGLPAVQLHTLIITLDHFSSAAPPAALPWVGIARWQPSFAKAAATAPPELPRLLMRGQELFRRTPGLWGHARHVYFCCARFSTGQFRLRWARCFRAASRVFWGARTTFRMGCSGTNGHLDPCTLSRSS